jgi:hypothetical protein
MVVSQTKEQMKQPQVIKIGPFLYSIFWDKNKIKQFSLDQGENHYGYCDRVKLEIVIDSDLDPQIQRVTLWHELKHACNSWVIDAIDNPNEEQLVTFSAPIEIQVLRDNPELVAWLTVA